MRYGMKRILLLFLLLYGGMAAAQDTRDSVRVYFRQGQSELDMSFRDNRNALESILKRLWEKRGDTLCLDRVVFIGGASPEGSAARNNYLSEQRAKALFDYLSRYVSLPDSVMTTEFLGRNWLGLIRLVENTPEIPYKEEVLELLREICEQEDDTNEPLARLMRLRGGEPYRYMYRHLFPKLRASQVQFRYKPVRPTVLCDTIYVRDTVWLRDTVYIEVPVEAEKKPFYMALKTNMLYDAALVPNIGVEFYLGKGWTVGGNWMYAWWNSDRKHNYWRIYGGDLNVRKYFGKKAKEKPLTGHHLGVYGGIVTYDFELGGKGYLGDRWSYHAGIEYGYSLPVAKRLNIDFGIGIGYLGGEYKEYKPIDNHYVWQATKQRHWFGPTKAEISLVWLIGRGNTNKGKGGAR